MQQTRTAQNSPSAVVYDALQILQFTPITPGGSIANSVINDFIILPYSCKIYAATICAVGTTIDTTAFNVIMGVAAEASPNPLAPNDTTEAGTVPPTPAVNGDALFATDQSVTLVTAVPQTFYPANFDAIFPKNALLSLRLVNSAQGSQTIKVSLAVKAYNIKPYAPQNVAWSPSVNLV